MRIVSQSLVYIFQTLRRNHDIAMSPPTPFACIIGHIPQNDIGDNLRNFIELVNPKGHE
jgi:hypothetical protein